jgi:hypothetical protein
LRNDNQPLSISRRAYAALFSFVALALVACGDPAATALDVDPDAPLSPERLTPRLVLAPELAMQGVAAVELWSAATRDAFVPDLSIGECGRSDEDLCIRIVEEPPIGCGAQVRGAVACFRGATIDVWQGVRDDWTVSVLAHELGHSLGLGHVREGLMSPDRDRTKPCIESDDIVALDDAMGVPGSPACVR